MPVVFDELNHKYTNPENGIDYISATTLLGKYKPKFDLDKNAANVARREGLTVEEVKTYWKDLNRISTTRGTAIHSILENYIKTRERGEEEKELVDYIERELKLNSEFEANAEERLYNDEYYIAGTADIILENNKFFKIWDLKTNKKFRFTNTFKEDVFLLDPVDHLVNCEYSNYALQLSLYAYMKEALTGKKCIELRILHLERQEPETIVKEIYLPYLKSDIFKILEHKKNFLDKI